MTTNDLTHDRLAWDTIADGYDRTNTPSQMWLGNEGLRRVGLGPGMVFVDVAAGSGALSIPAARLGAQGARDRPLPGNAGRCSNGAPGPRS